MENAITQVTKLEIIDKVLGIYIEDPGRRATTSNGSCRYRMADGRMCAVGQCLDTDHRRYGRLVEENPAVFGAWEFSGEPDRHYHLDEFLRPEFRGHSVEFWGELQNIHDVAENWDEDGLSEKGQLALAKLRKASESVTSEEG